MTVIKIPERNMLIEIRVPVFEHVEARVIGILKYAEVRKATKYFDHGLYVQFSRVLYVEEFDDAGTEHLKETDMQYYALKGEWRKVPDHEMMGKVL
jgi:hypothetical protein